MQRYVLNMIMKQSYPNLVSKQLILKYYQLIDKSTLK